VQTLRNWVCGMMAFAVVLCWAANASGQEAEADKAKALLQQAVAQYNALDFSGAQATLLKIQEDALSDSEKATRNEYLQKVGSAVRQQRDARAAYEAAQEALGSGNLDAAEKGFEQAAGSEYLPNATRTDAKAQLRLVQARKQRMAAKADTGAEARETAVAAANAPAENVEAKAADEAKAAAADTKNQADKMLAEMADRRKKAMELVALGDQAMDAEKPDEAVKYYSQAADIEPDNVIITRKLNSARQITGTSGSAGLLSQYHQQRIVAQRATVVDFEKQMKRSQEVLAGADRKQDFEEAEQAAKAALNILESGKSLFTEREFRERRLRVEKQEEFIAARLQEWERKTVQEQINEAQRLEMEREREAERRRMRKVETLRNRGKTLLEQREYAKALEVMDQIARIDPEDPWTTERRDLVYNFVLMQTEKGLVMDRNREERKQFLELRRAEIPWYEYMQFPADWRELTKRREFVGAGAATESEADRETRKKLRQKLARLDFDDIEFQDVIRFLREVSGANIYVKWKALEAMGIDRSATVTVHLQDVSLEKALDIILSDVGGVNPLSYIIEEGVITISTKDDLASNTITRVYDIRDLIIRVPNFTGPRLDLSNASNNGGSNNNGTSTGGGLFGDNNTSNDTGEDEVKPKSEIIADIITMVTKTIDQNSWSPPHGPGEVGAIQELHGQLIITQTPQNHEAVMALIEQLRQANALQINIEARFLSVSTGFLNSIGMDLDFYFNLGSQLGSNYTRDPATGELTGGQVRDPFTGALVPTTSGTPTPWGPNKPGTNTLTPIGISQNSFGFGNMVGKASPASNSIGTAISNPALTIAGTFLSDIQVDFLLQATQAHQTTRQLTAPRLTLFNGQRAYVSVATQQAYVAGLEPVVSDNAVSVQPIIGYVPTGTTLDVEATVSADRRYVTMTVRPQISVLNSLTSVGDLQLPNATVQEVQTTVIVPDGGTLLLGGQMTTGEIEQEMGVPLVSKIPILNRAFTNRGKVRDEQTLLILIKPKIIIPVDEERRQFP